MDTNDQLKFPKFNWDKILKISAVLLGVVFIFACLSRSRTAVRLSQIADVVIVVGLLLFLAYAIVKRYTKK